MAEDLVLQLEGISKQFPGVKALEDVNFDLRRGEVHMLVGENGAGKSTLIKILAGAYRHDTGRIVINGQSADIQNPAQSLAMGVSVIYQEFNLVPFLSVAQNIFLGREPRHPKIPGLIDHARMNAESQALLESLGVDIDPQTTVHYLGVAQQQMVEVAKALSVNAQIVVMDEPTSALTTREIEQLFASLDYSGFDQGYLAGEAAYRLLKGEKIPQQIMLPVVIVDKSNAQAYNVPPEQRKPPSWDKVVAAQG
jgi:ribose transport system ATP-binding protein